MLSLGHAPLLDCGPTWVLRVYMLKGDLGHEHSHLVGPP
jgi:hypothetical protein